MSYNYKTQFTCASNITFDLEGDKVTNIQFYGGCDGNLRAISRILEGKSVSEIEGYCRGVQCGRKPTSCSDQLAIAVRKAYDEEQGK